MERVKTAVDFALLAEVLDSIDDPFCVIDHVGRIQHENDAFLVQIGRHEQPECLRDEMRQLARRTFIGLSDGPRGQARGNTGRVAEFQAASNRYRARASLMRRSADDSSPLVLVTLEQVTDASHAKGLCETHRLTPREVQVAELLAEGHSNLNVAQMLGVSTHTARHHTGRVISKLQARGRAEVGAMVRRLQR